MVVPFNRFLVCIVVVLSFTCLSVPLTAQEVKPKQYVAHIVINLAEQHLYALDEYGYVILDYPISSGLHNSTPTGNFKVHNKSTSAYSRRYSATMTHWMAITGDGAYGMHGLLGSSYYRKIGSPASHGCIRLRREDAAELYKYVHVGIPVDIVHIDNLELPRSENAIGERGADLELIAKTLEHLYGDSSL